MFAYCQGCYVWGTGQVPGTEEKNETDWEQARNSLSIVSVSNNFVLAKTLASTTAEQNIDAAEWEVLMDDTKTLIKEAEGKVAHAAVRIDDLMEIAGSSKVALW